MPRYTATLSGKQEELEIEDLGDHRFRVRAFGEEREIDARLTGQSLSVLQQGEVQQYQVSRDKKTFTVERGSQQLAVDVEDSRRASLARSNKKASGHAVIKSPMPGRIARVLVEEGAQVKERQGLVVLEAMKMENELRSPRDGVVLRIVSATRVGSAVEGGEELVVIG